MNNDGDNDARQQFNKMQQTKIQTPYQNKAQSKKVIKRFQVSF